MLPTRVVYAVRIPRGGQPDALIECVITCDCNGQAIKTRGVHSNRVFAGRPAVMRILNLQLRERVSARADVPAPGTSNGRA